MSIDQDSPAQVKRWYAVYKSPKGGKTSRHEVEAATFKDAAAKLPEFTRSGLRRFGGPLEVETGVNV